MNLPLIHGGDIYSEERTWLDFSANINPLGIPAAVQEALVAAIPTYSCYPDPLNRRLSQRIAVAEGCPPDAVVCGNGAADLIYRLALALQPRQALLLAPTFAEYGQALRQVGCTINHHNLDEAEDFRLTDTILEAIQPGLDVLFLCNPNNPNGWPAPQALMRQILERCSRFNVTLVVDECFVGFLPDPLAVSLVDQLAAHPKLVVLKAMTKLYALAGVRLGYLMTTDRALRERLFQAGPPWSVSAVATACGLAALDCQDYVAQSRALVSCQREALIDGLQALGCKVYPSAVNYILFKSPAPNLHHVLRSKGILIRDCANYPNLSAGYYRVAVRLPAEQDQLLAAMTQILKPATITLGGAQ